jgi:hypothetical protein
VTARIAGQREGCRTIISISHNKSALLLYIVPVQVCMGLIVHLSHLHPPPPAFIYAFFTTLMNTENLSFFSYPKIADRSESDDSTDKKSRKSSKKKKKKVKKKR